MMPGENEELDPEVVHSAEEESGFDTGFNSETPTETPGEVVEKDEPQAQANEPAPDLKYVQLTEEQFNKLMATTNALDEFRTENIKKLDQVFGQLGAHKQVIERLQSSAAQGQPIDINDDVVSELREEFPEIADLTLKSLKKIAGSLKGTADPEAINKVEERMSKVKDDLINSALDTIVDGSWKDEVRSESFKAWQAKQPPEVNALGYSDSPRDASRMLRLYMAAKTKPQAEPPAPPSTRARQLSAAVNPKSAGTRLVPATTEEDAFDEGFKAR